jgi:hypothetical protein
MAGADPSENKRQNRIALLPGSLIDFVMMKGAKRNLY